MTIPTLFNLRKLHIFILTFPFRILFIPTTIWIILLRRVYIPVVGLEFKDKPDFARLVWEFPFRLMILALFGPLILLVGEFTLGGKS